ncbi:MULTISPECIES: CheR family methyltransferase [unclassified Yoonia]|uniref:CheR family methyltransferase n=1 Tax=unclassified Yoonia TaxID=2629118 RepID=UPI002AFF43B1|nr:MULTISPECIES: CheR family methyltransferase [unclassified Yoonia]
MPKRDPDKTLHVVALGASAGGLEACRAVLRDIPAETQAAFILILHQDPAHDGMMVDLLKDHTGLTVVQASQDMELQPGTLHVIPPGLFLRVKKRILHLSKPDKGKGVRLPFDLCLRSLAKDKSVQPACIVLSGTADDGSAALADFAKAGGLVIAQDPGDARYPGMPQSAIDTGHVAQILATADMKAAITAFVATSQAGVATDQPETSSDDVLDFIRSHGAQDLSLYKRGTLERRVARRMALIGLGPDDNARYLAILREDKDERSQLSADLLIHVTSFFRDAAVFDHLSTKALPDLLAAHPGDRPLRIWVAGCSTGEEAYSLAMICMEAVETSGFKGQVQVLASDIDPEAIATARAGYYSADIEASVSPARLERFFIPEDGGWRVTSRLRDIIVFTVADLLSDPPFSKIDLVSCRNVLIYLTPDAQKRVIARTCFALRQGGLLLLGAAEMPGASDTCFTMMDKSARLWQRTGNSQPQDLDFAVGLRDDMPPRRGASPAQNASLANLCRRIVLEYHAPAAVLFNARFETLYLLGPTERYLKFTQGHPSTDLVGLLPKAVRTRFRNAVASCNASNTLATVAGSRTPGQPSFDIVVHLVSGGAQPMLLACFVDRVPMTSEGDALSSKSTQHNVDLEHELATTRTDLSEALRDLEEEIEAHGTDAAEARSIHEEFQSTNEELLASKEELQSLNEELTALNVQLQETLERHRTTANDLQNVLYSTDVATLFLDLDLTIRFFTPAARQIFRVIPSDVGRPFTDLASVARDDDLIRDTQAVLASNDPMESEAPGGDDKWFLRRIQPYRAEGNKIDGLVITYIDITERKRATVSLITAMDEAERATKAKSRFLASASHDLRQPLQSMALLHKLLARHRPSTEALRLTAILDQTLNSMTLMLDSMLDVNRIESGTVRPDIQPVAIGPLMQRLADEVAPQADLKGLRLRAAPCSLWVMTDPQLLEQMLRNLLSNAVKYTVKGGMVLGCRRRNGQVVVQVCDSGIGIADTDTKAIFNAYHRVDTDTVMTEQGMGLGLAIVQRLAMLMDHPVAVQSRLGKGSCFSMTLEIVDKAAQADVPKPGGRIKPQTGTILLVEDEDPLRELMTKMLAKAGHTVIAKADAKSALSWAGSDPDGPDLLLTDYDLAEADNGLTLAQDLTDMLGDDLPTIILTGDITTETLKAIDAAGFRQVIKPVLPDVLLDQISALLTPAKGARPVRKKRTTATSEAGTTVHVVDDHLMVRETMRRLFEVEGWAVKTYASSEEFLAAPRPQDSDCVLVDNHLPGMDGAALIATLRDEGYDLPMVMLTGHGDVAIAVAAFKAGASDLIEKPASAAVLLASLRHAMVSKPGDQGQSKAAVAARKRFASLTPRETDVLGGVLEGAPNKIIAADLGINQRTVENHRASVMRKTGATSLPALVRLAHVGGVQGKTD